MSKVYIRSQNRETLFALGESADYIAYAEIPTPGKWKDKSRDPVEFSHALVTKNLGRLGIYESKKRCLEILDNIQMQIAAPLQPVIYQMPEK